MVNMVELRERNGDPTTLQRARTLPCAARFLMMFNRSLPENAFAGGKAGADMRKNCSMHRRSTDTRRRAREHYQSKP
jgi:hypothetical protein